MTSLATEQEKVPEKEQAPDLLPPIPSTPSSDAPISPSSALVSGLGTGHSKPPTELTLGGRGLVPTLPEASGPPPMLPLSLGSGGSVGSGGPVPAPAPTSGQLLTALAKPKVFPGPQIDLQNQLVKKLDDSILANANTIKAPTAITLYVGSVVLTSVPTAGEGEQALIATAPLVKTDQALGPMVDAYEAAMLGGAERDIVRNTLETMIAAGQMDYLRASGIVGPQWSVVVEVHYYRDRPKNAINVHKDTLGQTLFVNLNYLNSKPMPAPETLLNPPLVPTHEQRLAQTLPQQFRDDLDETRGSLPIGREYDAGELPAYGVVSFVDEAVHHATPMLKHRSVPIADFKTFVQTDAEFKDKYAEAEKAWDASHPKGLFSRMMPIKPFARHFVSKSKGEEAMWEGVMDLLHEKGRTEVDRSDLLASNLTNEHASRLLQHFGPKSHSSVNIPSRARADGATKPVPMMEPTSPDQPMRLERRMSQLALADKMPKDPDPEGKRAFFRTWVRAVPVAVPAPSPSAVVAAVRSAPAPIDAQTQQAISAATSESSGPPGPPGTLGLPTSGAPDATPKTKVE